MTLHHIFSQNIFPNPVLLSQVMLMTIFEMFRFCIYKLLSACEIFQTGYGKNCVVMCIFLSTSVEVISAMCNFS